jgi:hypothetical protein
LSPSGQGQRQGASNGDVRCWRWRRSEHALWREALDDVVVADRRGREEPFALAGGASLWRALAEPVALEDVPVAAGEASALAGLLEDLRRRGVVDRLADR